MEKAACAGGTTNGPRSVVWDFSVVDGVTVVVVVGVAAVVVGVAPVGVALVGPVLETALAVLLVVMLVVGVVEPWVHTDEAVADIGAGIRTPIMERTQSQA